MAWCLKWFTMSRAIQVQFLRVAETLCHPWTILCGTEPVSALTRHFINFCSPNNFFFLGFCQWQADTAWQGFNSLNKHLTFTVLAHLNQGPRFDNMCMHGVWCQCDYRVSEKMSQRCLAHEWSKILDKRANARVFSSLIPQTAEAMK